MTPVTRRIGLGLAALAISAVAPTTAAAETRSFYDATPLFPTGPASGVGPANDFPSTITVAGVPGTVTRVEVTLFGFGSVHPDDADAVLVGPNGAKVMLLSDVCGTQSTSSTGSWTFDDAAPIFMSNNGPCQTEDEHRFRPSNFVGNDGVEEEDLSIDPGGPVPPYVNNLASLAGGSPNGAWELFLRDDESGFFGFAIDGWALRLEVEPPPATPANTGKPQLSGKAKTGKTLTCEPGAWTGASSFAFAWLRNGDAIAGESKATLELKRRDGKRAIQCEVTATGAGGTTVEQSRPVVPKKAKR